MVRFNKIWYKDRIPHATKLSAKGVIVALMAIFFSGPSLTAQETKHDTLNQIIMTMVKSPLMDSVVCTCKVDCMKVLYIMLDTSYSIKEYSINIDSNFTVYFMSFTGLAVNSAKCYLRVLEIYEIGNTVSADFVSSEFINLSKHTLNSYRGLAIFRRDKKGGLTYDSIRHLKIIYPYRYRW